MDDAAAERAKYLAAKTYVRALKGFYIHLGIFAAVMTALLAADFAVAGTWWVQWPFIGWGLGILGHAYLVFRPARPATGSWEERKIKETLAKM
jgi:hypothetical protein